MGLAKTSRAVLCLSQGRGSLGVGDTQDAISHFLQGLTFVSVGSTGYLLKRGLVEAYREVEERAKAIEVLEDIARTALHDETYPSPLRRAYRFSTDAVTVTAARLEALEEIADLHGEAGAHDEQAEALARLADAAQATDLRLRARALREKADVEGGAGNLRQALVTIEQALEEARARSNALDRAEALLIRAEVARNLGDRETAHTALTEALDDFTKAADASGQARTEDRLGLLAYWGGDFEAAHRHFAALLAHARSAGSDSLERLAVKRIGQAEDQLSRPDETP